MTRSQRAICPISLAQSCKELVQQPSALSLSLPPTSSWQQTYERQRKHILKVLLLFFDCLQPFLFFLQLSFQCFCCPLCFTVHCRSILLCLKQSNLYQCMVEKQSKDLQAKFVHSVLCWAMAQATIP
jgi:hypothetical protein